MQPGASVSIQVSSYSMSLISSSTSFFFFSSLPHICFPFAIHLIFFIPLVPLFCLHIFVLFCLFLVLFLSQISQKFSCRSPSSSPLTVYSSPLCFVAICLLLFSPLSSLAAPSPIFLYPLSAVTSASLLPPPLSPTTRINVHADII